MSNNMKKWILRVGWWFMNILFGMALGICFVKSWFWIFGAILVLDIIFIWYGSIMVIICEDKLNGDSNEKDYKF